MFKNELTLNAFNRDYLQKIASDLTDADLDTATNGKTPRWILGHLRLVADMPRAMVGLTSQLDDAWSASFGPGSETDAPSAPSFSVEQVVADSVAAYDELANAAQQADPSVMSQPHGLGLLDGTPIVTCGDLVSHLLSTHFAFHLAQLSACRQAKGLGHFF